MSAPRRRTIARLATGMVGLSGDTAGAVAVEYGLLAAMVAMVALVGIVALGDSLAALPLQSLIDAFVAALS